MNILNRYSPKIDISEIHERDLVKIEGVLIDSYFTCFSDKVLREYELAREKHKDELLEVIRVKKGTCPYCFHNNTCVKAIDKKGTEIALSCYFDFSKNGRKVKTIRERCL